MRKVLALAALAIASITGPAHAQSDYPNKPVKMIVGFAAGGISDVLRRAVAAKMTTPSASR
jgi:tripartite-type tricarboxylate transporter receptor subunit TctC